MPAPKKITHHRRGGEYTFEELEADAAARRAAAAKSEPKTLAPKSFAESKPADPIKNADGK